ALGQELTARGYERVERVEIPGTFSIRGGIIDVYPLTLPRPVRIDLFDDEVDTLRSFDPVTQRSQEALVEILIPPARESLFPAERAAQAGDAILELAARQERRLIGLGREEAAAQLTSRVGEHVEKMLSGIYFEGIEQYKPFFYKELHTLLAYVRHGAVVLDEPVRLREQFTAARR